MPVTVKTPAGLTPRIPYAFVTVDLGVARNNETIVSGGRWDFATVQSLIGARPVTMRINHKDAAPIPLSTGAEIVCPPAFLRIEKFIPPIQELFLTNESDPGGRLVLALGGDAAFRFSVGAAVIVHGQDTLILRQEETRNAILGERQRVITGVDLSSVLAATETPLAAGAEWISGWFSVDRYATMVMTVVADQILVLKVEQSWDGIEVDAQETRDYPSLGSQLSTGDGYFTDIVAPFARLRAQNVAAVNQTLCRIRVAGRAV